MMKGLPKTLLNAAYVLTMVAATLVGCGAGGSETDPKKRWLNGVPCAPPCWEDIYPGVTTVDEAVQLLRSNPFIDPEDVEVAVESDGRIDGVAWQYQSGRKEEWSGWLLFYPPDVPSLIEEIVIVAPDLCLREIIDAYGEPDYLETFSYRVAGLVNLIWQAEGFFYSVDLDNEAAGITKKLCGGVVVHFKAETSPPEIPSMAVIDLTDEDFIPWTGYGEYPR